MREIPCGNDCNSPSSRESGLAALEIDVPYVHFLLLQTISQMLQVCLRLPSRFLFSSWDKFCSRATTRTFILYMQAVTSAAMEKVKWRRFIFLPLSSVCDGVEKIRSVNLQIHSRTFSFENMSEKRKQEQT